MRKSKLKSGRKGRKGSFNWLKKLLGLKKRAAQVQDKSEMFVRVGERPKKRARPAN